MVQIKKSFGTFPEEIGVLDTAVTFNEEGIAEVEEQAIVDVLTQIPGYEVITAEASEEIKVPKEDPTEDEPIEEVNAPVEASEAPKAKPTPRRKTIKK